MKPGFSTGTTGELKWIVTPDRTITLGNNPDATVFATPFMIQLMERAAREALRPHLEPGEESVGAEVSIRHLGAALPGTEVRGTARVTSIEGRMIGFDVAAWCGDRKIGEGTHKRAVIALDRFLDRLGRDRPAIGRVPPPPPSTGDTGEGVPTFQTLRVSVSGDSPVATVTLNRPDQLNAIDTRMTADLEALVHWLSGQAKAIRVVILTGAGKAFSCGDDVKELKTIPIAEARELSLRQASVYLGFERLPQVLIAAVNGHALGAGCVCAAACDFRVAAHTARFGMPEIKLGWAPGYGVSQLGLIVGKSRAIDLCLTGRIIPARTAAEWGLVHELAPVNRLLPRARELADSLLQLPAIALRETKRLLHADDSPHTKTTHRLDTEAYIRCLQTPDAREGIDGFREKRAARFVDR